MIPEVVKWIDFMRWVGVNVVLALISVGLAPIMVWLASHKDAKRPVMRLGLLVAVLLWLVFLPNSCYLFTEWRHYLEMIHGEHLFERWVARDYEALLILIRYFLFYLAFSAVGALTFVLSVRPLHRFLRGRVSLWLAGPPFFFLMSLGVYLGLRARFNTWDIIMRPLLLWDKITDAFSQQRLPALVIGFAVLLWLVYLVMDVWVDGCELRLQQRKKLGVL
jgi:uncharacterized membrane protein